VAVVKDTKQTGGILRWFHETRGELRKVVWPTREEALRLTYVVIAISLIMGAVLGAMDLLLNTLYGMLV